MERLWQFSDNLGSFEFRSAHKIKSLYFPLCNESLFSSITPDLHGDIKSGQNSYLLQPVSRIDLTNLKSSRNFWVYLNNKVWSVAGVSKDLKQIQADKFLLEAGMLWQKVSRENKKIGLKSEILSFIPSGKDALEIMQVKITNISLKAIEFTPTAAIPMYARSANNIRDHRHVTSLLQRVSLHKFGVVVKPTLVFAEAGHHPNKDNYFVLGVDEKSQAPQYIYPTQEMFCGEAGDLEAPLSVLENKLPDKNAAIQGKESMGALRFRKVSLKPRESRAFIILMGIAKDSSQFNKLVSKFNSLNKVKQSLNETKDYWASISCKINISSGDSDFDNWFRWVNIQPTLRRVFGCSFLPDFDYGKGGLGWRDLWQDCLGLILSGSSGVRNLLIANFGGVRPDGTNATIIGKSPGEFIADRNNLSRVWMDHGIWPLLTLDLYINETGDYNILFEKAPYFCDRHPPKAKGTILEHLLLQHLRQFKNLGAHKFIRLEGADWNDGLDMAKENGESVAFSCMYAHNLKLLAKLTARDKKPKSILLAKQLEKMAGMMFERIRKSEWLKEGFFNGYYDNKGKRVEGRKNGFVRMMLASQVFPIMSGVADERQINEILKSIKKYLLDKKLNGYHLNTDFRSEQHDLGRAFSFVYGDKENGAFFNHMVVMLAYALYKRGLAKEGWKVLNSIYSMARDTVRSKIYPCIPEYFNLEGRGMYSYLTGSASWFVLTLLTQAFGVSGKEGDLVIEPKLSAEQFGYSGTISIERNFSGRRILIKFFNPNKLSYGKYKIIKASLNSKNLASNGRKVVIERKKILGLSSAKAHSLVIALG